MITGVETAGLVLAVLPLLISAFEHYNDTKGALRKFFNKKQYIKRVIEALDEQRVLIENELDFVLKLAGFAKEGDTVGVLSYSHLLARKDVSDGMAGVLGRSYEPYIRSVNRCGTSVLEIAKRLKGLMDTEEFSLETLARFAGRSEKGNGKFEFCSRIRVSLDVDGLDIRLKELDESTNMMSRLRISGQEVEEHEPVSGKAHKRALTFLTKFRNHASSIYGAMARSWDNKCHPSHTANVYLQPTDMKLEKRPYFHLQVCFTGMDLQSGREMLLLKNLVIVTRLDHDHTAGKNSSKVAFAQGTLRQPTIREVEDLCAHLTFAQSIQRSMRLFVDDAQLHFAMDEPKPNLIDAGSMLLPFTTLDGVLSSYSGLSRLEQAQFWSTAQRMQLAATLASSMLQLCTTPWLAAAWSRKNIYFHMKQPSTTHALMAFEADHPFLVQPFRGKATIPACSTANQGLLELSIILLEILNKQTIESWAIEQSHTTPLTSFAARCYFAGLWLDYSAPEMLPKYRGAVASCLDLASSRAHPSRSWEDAELQKTVLETVVQPLVTACT